MGPASPPLGNASESWAVGLDGALYASPLIVGGRVIVATENDTVYSLEISTGNVAWKVHLGDPVDASTLPCGDIRPVSGITGTPAADPAADLLYVVAFLSNRQHVLFTLSLVDGSVVAQRVIDPPGADPRVEQQRGALAIGAGFVYVPFGGLWGDCGSYHGYVVGAPIGGGALNLYRTPGTRSGIWAAAGPTVAGDGTVYAVTGNGSPTSTFAFSNSVIALSPALGVTGYFAPSNWQALDAGDIDLGSAGVAIMDSGVAFVVGKAGVAYVLRTDALGGVGGQAGQAHVCNSAFGGTAWSNQTVYVPCTNGLFAVNVAGQSLAVAWHASVVSNGSPILAAGAVWAIDTSSSTLYALDPDSGNVRYSMNLGASEHFGTPAATNGYVIAPAGMRVIAIATG